MQTRALLERCRRDLGLDRLFAGIRQELHDMNRDMEGETTRRQNASMVRLTVVTTVGLIGTVSTGFLGMNLFGYADETLAMNALGFREKLHALKRVWRAD